MPPRYLLLLLLGVVCCAHGLSTDRLEDFEDGDEDQAYLEERLDDNKPKVLAHKPIALASHSHSSHSSHKKHVTYKKKLRAIHYYPTPFLMHRIKSSRHAQRIAGKLTILDHHASWSFWVLLTHLIKSECSVMLRGTPKSPSPAILMNKLGGLHVHAEGRFGLAKSKHSYLHTGHWTHVAVVHQEYTLRFYVDGRKVSTTFGFGGPPHDKKHRVYTGSPYVHQLAGCDTKVADVRFRSGRHPFTSAEVRRLHGQRPSFLKDMKNTKSITLTAP